MMTLVICVLTGIAPHSIGFVDKGDSSAKEFALKSLHAKMVDDRFDGFDTVWWHGDQTSPTSGLTPHLREFVEKGGGLLLTGTALTSLNSVGIESAPLRRLEAGSDNFVAGFRPLIPTKTHPLFQGLTGETSVTSGGHPPTADFHGTGGPIEGIPIAQAWPDEGEWPIVEYAVGKGRILAIGWRLPDYGRANNRYRANLERLTRNALDYLAGHKWFDISPVRQWMNRPITVDMVPNSHGTICGWLLPWSGERQKVADILNQHLYYMRNQPSYRFALSEVPNLITAKEKLTDDQWMRLKEEMDAGRVELVNSFFLEPDTNLADGEALCQMAIQGVRWQQEEMGRTPSTCWMIDAVGMHAQMPQIVSKTGISSIVFTRGNPTGSTVFRWRSPDGSELFGVNWPVYGWFGQPEHPGSVFAEATVHENALRDFEETKRYIALNSPTDAALVPTGYGDYSLPPAKPGFAEQLIEEWNAAHPKDKFQFTTPSSFLKNLKSDGLPVLDGELGYSWLAFNVNMPWVRQRFRHSEHLLMEAEKAATLANLHGFDYPAQDLYTCWIQLLLNMDRNTIWGAAIESVFRGDEEWNATDRFDFVDRIAGRVLEDALRYVGGKMAASKEEATILVFNPLSWPREETCELPIAPGTIVRDNTGRLIPTQTLDGKVVGLVKTPALGYTTLHVSSGVPTESKSTKAATIKTPYYTLTINPTSGAIASLKDKGGKELLSGESNELRIETGAEQHFPAPRQQRKIVGTSGETKPAIAVEEGPLAWVITVENSLGKDSPLRRQITLYRHSPRIDFKTRLDWRGESKIVSVHFRLPGNGQSEQGIPYGRQQRGEGLFPVVGWSDHGGAALLDKGITNREAYGDDVALLLLNSLPQYIEHPCPSLAGNGINEFEYALLPHDNRTNIAAESWKYEEPLIAMTVSTGGGNLAAEKSYLQTGPNIVAAALRREGAGQVLRLVNLSGKSGKADLKIGYDQTGMTTTNLLGIPMDAETGMLHPQEIRTLAIKAGSGEAKTKPIREWRELTTKVRVAPKSGREEGP